MVGYSGTPLPKKLGISPGARVCFVNAPEKFGDEHLSGIAAESTGSGPFDVILLFCVDRKTLETSFERLSKKLNAAGGLWICWPKKSSGIATDLNENLIRDFCLKSKLVDNKVCAVTDVWSGLRFVVRVEHRPDWPSN